jgi:hypothetical protein
MNAMATKLPEHLLKPRSRTLADVKLGETVYILASSMRVAADRSCCLKRDAEVAEESALTIRVSRMEDGYHVTIISKLPSWTPSDRIPEDAFGVASVTVDLKRELDLDANIQELARLVEQMKEMRRRDL